jgi:two-component system, OmpR family, sensor histidine kinase VicK
LAIQPFPPQSGKKSEIIYGVENAVGRGIYFMSNVKNKMDICFDHRAPSIVVENEEYSNGYTDIRKRGGKIRAFTEITKDNIHYCKKLMKLVDELRHLDGVKGGIAVSETEYMATTVLEEAKPLTQVIYSNVKEVVEQGQYIFDTLWNQAISAEQRIREIEEGIEPEFFEVISDPNKSSQILLDLAKSVKEEALLLLPNDKAMVRVERLGVIDYMIKASQENGAAIKIICPLSKENSKITKRISEHAAHIKILNGNNSQTGMFIVDSTNFLRAELKEPKADEFSEAIGFTVYSNSRRSIDSFKSVFELLWNERTLNEELKRADIMQKEFINVAAHELRTPIQPIIGISDVLHSRIKDTEQRELLDVVIRNAKRLQRLTEDILDVARIETESLMLRKSQFNLKELILNTITDYKTQIKKEDKVNKLVLVFTTTEDNDDDDIFVYGDTGRITQVISNLLSNAIKFTEEGTITAKIEKRIDKNNQEQIVTVCIKDTGKGIDPTIRDKLFEKFATRSEKGMGLGLYLSRKIIEAHGGKIWAENNTDGKGATFYFSLPLSNRDLIADISVDEFRCNCFPG